MPAQVHKEREVVWVSKGLLFLSSALVLSVPCNLRAAPAALHSCACSLCRNSLRNHSLRNRTSASSVPAPLRHPLQYYDIPSLSLRSAAHRLMQKGVGQFKVSGPS